MIARLGSSGFLVLLREAVSAAKTKITSFYNLPYESAFSTVYVCSTATITWVCQVDSIMPWIFMNEHDISPASCLCQWLMQQWEGSLHVQMTTRLVFRPYIYRRPRALQVQAKANIVLIKLKYNYDEEDAWWQAGGDLDILDVNCGDCRDCIPSTQELTCNKDQIAEMQI